MNDWHSTWLGRRSLPRDLSGFEIEERRGPALEIALAPQIGFLRMTGQLLEAVHGRHHSRLLPRLITLGFLHPFIRQT